MLSVCLAWYMSPLLAQPFTLEDFCIHANVLKCRKWLCPGLFIYLLFCDRVSLSSPGCPGSLCVH